MNKSLQEVRLDCLRLAIDSVSDNTDVDSIISISRKYEDYVSEQRIAPLQSPPPTGNVG